MTTRAATDENFADLLKSGPVLLDFWAEWCPHCLKMLPVLEELSDELGDRITIATMDIEANPETPGRYGVRGVPAMMLFKDGKLAATKVGAAPKSKIVEWLNETA